MIITAKKNLQGTIAAIQPLNATIENNLKLSGSVGIGGVSKDSLEKYDGVYEIIPRTFSQVLETSQKFLSEDVLVEEIPYAEVSNTANGITATIADPTGSGGSNEQGNAKVSVTDDGKGNLMFTGVFVKRDTNGNLMIGDEK